MAKVKYPSYKASKALWQGEIPSNWQETELRILFADNKNKNIGLVERNLLSLSYGKLKRKDIDNATGLVPASFEGYQIIEKGYIVLRFTDLQNDKKSLRVGYSNERGIITSAYIGLAPKANIHSKYFYYLLHFLDKIKYFYNLGGGVRQSLAFKEFGRETILIPTKDEQIKIADFLDYKLSKIERFISRKKQLIKLLNEQKAAIINESVLKGLNPDSPLKEIGIEWLNKIPAHWKSGFCFQVFKEKKVKNIGLLNKNRLSLSYGNIVPKSIEDSVGLIPMSYETYQIVEIGNIILRLTDLQNDKKSLRTGLVRETGIISSAYLCIELRNTTNVPEYFQKLLHAYDQFKVFYNIGGGVRQSMGFEELKKIPIIIPPVEEQTAIVSYIHEKIASINSAVSKINVEIALVEEYKTSIIAETVTGKIDVRNYEIPNPEEETFEDIEEELSIAAEDNTEYQTISE